MSTRVTELNDDATLAEFFKRDRLWMAYALCDLEPPYRASSRYLGAVQNDRVTAVVLVYAVPRFTGLLTFGDVAGVASILAEAQDLPPAPFLLMGEEHAEVVGDRYAVWRQWTMQRMALMRDCFQAAPARSDVRRLSPADLPAIEALYGVEGLGFLDPAILHSDFFFGAYDGEGLVAIAGTHAFSRCYRLGAVGGVFTRPDHRSQGLATATTSAVAQSMLEAGADEIVLNVSVENEPALRAYRRLGFSFVRTYLEGETEDGGHRTI
ncbi:MAG TPA: GNAT family N-acetyltransferase [Chloroflexota bacterium]